MKGMRTLLISYASRVSSLAILSARFGCQPSAISGTVLREVMIIAAGKW